MEDEIAAMKDMWFGHGHSLVTVTKRQSHAVREMQSFKAG